MDQKLVSWARAVKRRSGKTPLPPLWLFTDPNRMPDLLAAVAALPPGLCGVVFRHDGVPDRAQLGRQLSILCRRRRLLLVSAGQPVRGAGTHLRGGHRRPGADGLRTASAHDRRDLVRAARSGAALAFLSPAFPTRSHPGAPALGAVRWSALARSAPLPIFALGGVQGNNVRRLSSAMGVGAIGALTVA